MRTPAMANRIPAIRKGGSVSTEDPGYGKPHSGHQERRQRLHRHPDSKVCAAPDQVDGRKRENEGGPRWFGGRLHRSNEPAKANASASSKTGVAVFFLMAIL